MDGTCYSNWKNENKVKFCFWFSCRLTSKNWVAPENGKYGNMKSEATLLHFSHRLICSDCLGFWENQLLVSPCCPMLPEQNNLVAPYCLILLPPLDKVFPHFEITSDVIVQLPGLKEKSSYPAHPATLSSRQSFEL